MLVRFEGADLGYGGRPVLAGLTLGVERGERVALLGKSGAGKSTLLGAIRARLAADRIATALVPQDHALVPPLSVFHNIYMGRLDRRSTLRNLATLLRPFAGDVTEIAPLAGRLGLGDHLWQKVEALSGGQRQRTAVGRALHAGGAVLLADEPVSALDERQSVDVLGLLTERFETSIVALHDVDLARATATRLIGIAAGRIMFDGRPDAVPRSEIEALYG